MLKGTAKGKSVKPKKEKQDDAQTVNTKTIKGTDEKNKKKLGGKSEKNATARKKKNTIAGSLGDVSQGSEESESNLNSKSALGDVTDVQRNKKKKPISKKCEETVDKAVSDFFECAWKACAERFFITTAPTTVSVELRNTWLRIVEAEWQDPDMREKPATKPNRVFKRDEPPLPLAFDTWSRGAIVTLPSKKRESVMDPFIRDFNPFGELNYIPDPVNSPSAITLVDDFVVSEINSPEGVEDIEALETAEEEMEQSGKSVHGPGQETPDVNAWDFELDPILILNQSSSSSSSSEAAFGSREASHHRLFHGSHHSGLGTHHKKHVDILLSARKLSEGESTTDNDYSSPAQSSGTVGLHKHDARKSIHPKTPAKKFSPSQCGGKEGSGVFRLPLETTSEALVRMKQPHNNDERIWEKCILQQNAVDRGDIVQVSRWGKTSQDDQEEELVVQPLFEEHTPRATEDHDLDSDTWRPRAYSELGFKGQSLDAVASDLNKKFVKRRMVNLHGRFKRQALRSLAAKVKRSEGFVKPRISPPSPDASKSSIVSSSNNNKSSKKDNDKQGVAQPLRKASSFSASLTNMPNLQTLFGSNRESKPDLSYYLANLVSAAKGAASEPLLQALIKEHQQRHEEEEAKEATRLGRGGRQFLRGANRKVRMMGNVRASMQKRDFGSGITYGKFSTNTTRPNLYESNMMGGGGGGGRRRGRGRGQDQQKSNWRIACDYNEQCTMQRAPSDCQSTGTCSNHSIRPC